MSVPITDLTAYLCLPNHLHMYTETNKKNIYQIISPRANPGSEFVVANTLAKWKELEPNEIDFSQGFSQEVVSRSCSVFNSLPAISDFCYLLITFANSLDPDQARQHVGPDLDPYCLTQYTVFHTV